MKQNIILQTDSYKLCHWKMYPAGTKRVYSYLEPRVGASYPTLFFGLQYILKEYLEGARVSRDDIAEASIFSRAHFNSTEVFNLQGWTTILADHGGRLPLLIKAVPEGTVVPAGNALMTVENTDDRLPWLTNAVESLLLKVWYPTTVASLSRYMREQLTALCLATGGSRADSSYMLHDFGYRGVSSEESAQLGGAAHLLSFYGTDTLQAMRFLQQYYGASLTGLALSVAASEHSIMTADGERGELNIARRIIAGHQNQIVSLVADSYNYYNFVASLCAEYELVKRCQVQLVIRPDSVTKEHDTPEKLVLWTLELIDSKLGHTMTSSGHRLLPYKVLWGDGIGPAGILAIAKTAKEKGYAVQNLVFGMGGGLLQKVNRDTQRFAFKCSAMLRDGSWIDVQKDPLDVSKRSKAGRLEVWQARDGRTETIKIGAPYPIDSQQLLQPVFENGVVLRQQGFDSIQRRG